MSEIYDIEDYREGEFLFAALAMCMNVEYDDIEFDTSTCGYRWVAGVPKDTSLFKLECPRCGAQNSFASVLPSEYLSEFGVEK